MFVELVKSPTPSLFRVKPGLENEIGLNVEGRFWLGYCVIVCSRFANKILPGKGDIHSMAEMSVKEKPIPVLLLGEIPDRYGVTRVVTLPRDSNWAFAYWEVAHESEQQAVCRLGHALYSQCRRTLRIHDITGLEFNGSNAHSSFDIHVGIFAEKWYIQMPAAGRSYVVDLGILTPDGEFIQLARSNTLHMPRNRMSEVLDEEWASTGSEEVFHLLWGEPFFSQTSSSGCSFKRD